MIKIKIDKLLGKSNRVSYRCLHHRKLEDGAITSINLIQSEKDRNLGNILLPKMASPFQVK